MEQAVVQDCSGSAEVLPRATLCHQLLSSREEVLIYRMRLANSGHSSVFKHAALGACLHDDRWIVLFQTGGVPVRGSGGSLLGA